ncbi:MAG TPA: ABC transporter permease [Terriglobia bacterium]|nr:ABC transporter permease [Terriglobia bacterium]
MIRQQSFYQRHEGLILGGTAVLLVVALWEYVWIKDLVSPLFFSGPSAIAKQFWYLLTEGSLRSDILFSGKNFIAGVSMATLGGVVLGVVIGWYRRIRLIFEPFLNALYATPRIAMMPLIIIWFGTGWESKVFLVFISAFFPILVNTVAGIRSLDPDLLRAARAFCASDWQIFKTVAIPGSVPFILTGIRQGVFLGLIGVVVGEMFGGSEGVGFLVAYGGQTFQTDTVFVGVVIIAVAGILLTFLTQRLERRFSRWRPER